DRALINLNTEFIAGIMMLVRGFVGEMHMTIFEPSGNPLVPLPDHEAFKFQSYVPLQLQNILEQTPPKVQILNTAKAILVGGAPVSYGLEQLLQQVQAPVFHTYGMTETVSHIALRQLNGPNKTQHYIAPPDVVLGTDKRGCLTIKADVTNNEIVVTNDLVNLLSENTFIWLGRADNTINTGGVKVQLEKVEQALTEVLHKLGMHRRNFIASLPDEKLGERIIAVLEGTPLSDHEEQQLQGMLTQVLTKYEIPKQFGYLNTFTETASGKIDRQKNLLLL
ncbi:MAG: acyl-CoA synthetase, partial [Hymenobacteraceae bacterium]|nr:acyl-CoA synthetase [Hymenobacteraceae bacterium]MDX5395204.1 acyl-CoA synthetase [Hymenobacteraceae bacterium]MDX5511242.1 acyl-CoA synthetase [Hymenobacteraceae bacterium]